MPCSEASPRLCLPFTFVPRGEARSACVACRPFAPGGHASPTPSRTDASWPSRPGDQSQQPLATSARNNARRRGRRGILSGFRRLRTGRPQPPTLSLQQYGNYKISRAFVDGRPAGNLSRDHILDNITLYWLTSSGASAARSYWEGGRAAAHTAGQGPMEVSLPVGFTSFPDEIFRAPKSWVEKAHRTLNYFNEVDKGGHVAAWEEPHLFRGTSRRFPLSPLERSCLTAPAKKLFSLLPSTGIASTHEKGRKS